MALKLENYNIRARYFPAILTAIPYTIIWYFLVNKEIIGYFQFANNISRIGNTTFFIVIVYLLLLTNRTVGKFIFENRYFDKGKDLPTTVALMPNSKHYSKEFRVKLSNKIQEDFTLTLPTLKDMESDMANTKLRIIEIVDSIRNKVKNGRLLLQHNIEYGFRRNLIGGLPIMIIVGSLGLYLLKINKFLSGFYIMLGFLICGLIILLLSKWLMNRYGEQYAKVLFQEYLGE